MASKLNGKKIAILATDGFEQAELLEPRKALEEAGAKTEIIAPKEGQIKGWNSKDWGESVGVDKTLPEARPNDYDALVLPGGVMNPDRLRMDPLAVDFVRKFAESGKTVAAICHGPWTLIEAGVIKGKNLTSWPSLKTDVINAGGRWVDREVVVDGMLVTSRKPDDIPAFNKKMLEQFSSAVAQKA